MVITFSIICLLALLVIAHDMMVIGMFGKTFRNYIIGGVVDQGESRKISFLCALALNHDIEVTVVTDEHNNFYLKFNEDGCYTVVDINEPSHKTYGNRMKVENNQQTSFNHILEPFGAFNISYKAKEDLQHVTQYCIANEKIQKPKYKPVHDMCWGFLE